MLKKILCSLALPATLLAFTVPAMADPPPQPIPQTLGIPDGVFNNLVEKSDDPNQVTCRFCHQKGTAFNKETIPNRHHLLVGTPIPDLTVTHGDATNYECLSCHTLVQSGTSYAFAPFRDCLLCHVQQEPNPDIPGSGASVHHLTDRAIKNRCAACHKPYIDAPPTLQANYPKGYVHYNDRTYDPSLVTPKPGQDAPAPGESKDKGYCDYCHDAGVDPVHSYSVKTNAETHHGTGLGLPGIDKCTMCHDTDQLGTNWEIRQCEACHTVASLHRIQADSNGDGVSVGAEDAYYGHIGNQADCAGCHVGYDIASDDIGVEFKAGVPAIAYPDPASVTAGTGAKVMLTGSAFITAGGQNMLTVMLTAANGVKTVVNPDSVSGDTLSFTVPTTLARGNYKVSVIRDGSEESNGVNLSLTPRVRITAANCVENRFVIKGAGFSQYVNATGSGTGVIQPGVGKCKVVSWTNSKIVAKCQQGGNEIRVKSVFGDVTYNKVVVVDTTPSE